MHVPRIATLVRALGLPALVAALVVVTGPGTALANPAPPPAPGGQVHTLAWSAPDHSCDPGDFCIFTDYWYVGQVWAWQGDDLDWWRNDGGSAGPNNRDHSWDNYGVEDYYRDVVVYKFGNGGSGSPTSPTVCVMLGAWGVGYDVPSADGQGSAHRWVHSCPSGVPSLGPN